MNILIVSYFYYPENTPRAFRAHELVKEFVKRDYKVTLVLPNKSIYKSCQFPNNVKVLYVGQEQKIANSNTFKEDKSKITRFIKRFLSNAKYYFFPLSFFNDFKKEAIQALNKINTSYDIVFSNSFPLVTHLALAKAFKVNDKLKASKVKIAEYSDPFYFQTHKKIFFFYKYIERNALKQFDYISIPTDKAKSSYYTLKAEDRIKILPQAYNLNEIKTEEFKENDKPVFSYAGMFYPGMRDPSFLFNYLVDLDIDFKFKIYTRHSNDEFISKYKQKLGDKLEVISDLSREEVVKELSKADFLINVDNISKNQTPSKLIDYAISNRPIFSASLNNFSSVSFDKFLNKNYEDQLVVDLSKHNISNVVDGIIALK